MINEGIYIYYFSNMIASPWRVARNALSRPVYPSHSNFAEGLHRRHAKRWPKQPQAAAEKDSEEVILYTITHLSLNRDIELAK